MVKLANALALASGACALTDVHNRTAPDSPSLLHPKFQMSALNANRSSLQPKANFHSRQAGFDFRNNNTLSKYVERQLDKPFNQWPEPFNDGGLFSENYYLGSIYGCNSIKDCHAESSGPLSQGGCKIECANEIGGNNQGNYGGDLKYTGLAIGCAQINEAPINDTDGLAMIECNNQIGDLDPNATLGPGRPFATPPADINALPKRYTYSATWSALTGPAIYSVSIGTPTLNPVSTSTPGATSTTRSDAGHAISQPTLALIAGFVAQAAVRRIMP